jgi:hypothetical protein
MGLTESKAEEGSRFFNVDAAGATLPEGIIAVEALKRPLMQIGLTPIMVGSRWKM